MALGATLTTLGARAGARARDGARGEGNRRAAAGTRARVRRGGAVTRARDDDGADDGECDRD